MAEYASRDRQYVGATASSSRAEPARELTPTERADQVAASAIRSVSAVRGMLSDVQAAVRANDPATWREARVRLDQALGNATRDLSLVTRRAAESSPEVRGRLEAARAALEQHERAARELVAAPTGWTPTQHDDSIIAALETTSAGPIALAFHAKESAALDVFSTLSPAEARALHARLATGQDRHGRYREDLSSADPRVRAAAEQARIADPVVEAFMQLSADRRSKLLGFLAGARRRQARQKVAAVAARGVANASSALPHRETIQRSFGKYDVGQIRAGVGGAAADSANELGARAYATGNSVAFAGPPDLHTAAHEAAHVIQQRAGVLLKGLDGGASDPLERHADAVADLVVRGESAEPLLDAIPGSSGSSGAAIQRAPKDHTAVARQPDEGPPSHKDPRSPWPVFEQSGKPYLIESAQDPVRFWVVSEWIRHSHGFHAHGKHATAPACAAEILAALGWVREDRIAYAAQHLVFDISRGKVAVEVAASAFYYIGLPSAKPVVSRASSTTLQVASPLPDPNTPAGTSLEIDDGHRRRVVDALASFTRLDPAPDAVERLRNDPRFQRAIAMSGVLQWSIDLATGNEIFGIDPVTGLQRYATWLDNQHPPEPKHDDTSKLKLENFYGIEIPGQIVTDREIVEADQPMWIDLRVAWPNSYPSELDYAVKPMVTPGHGEGMVSIVTCKWSVEREGGLAEDAIHTTTETSELMLWPKLPKGVEVGTYNVTIEASCDAYFAPRTFTKSFEVKSTRAAMAQLASATGASLAATNTKRTDEAFDSSGGGDDSHGQRMTGDLPPEFVPSKLGVADARAAGRAAERERLAATRMYLASKNAPHETLRALDREIAAFDETDHDLAEDVARGWQPFQIRGTYLSREEGVPSGTLQLYGSIHVERVPTLSTRARAPLVDTITVQIRDLSRKFDNKDRVFTGHGKTFEEALKIAFLHNAKDYPNGMMAVEAEAIYASLDGGRGSIGSSTGKMIGFQLGTDSRWKRFKAKVWAPVVSFTTNMAAMALMAFAPEAAPVIAPLLAAYNSAPVVDQMISSSENGTLTLGEASVSVGEIALNFLPMVGEAKPFTTGWFVLEGANWGGQAVLMSASARLAANEIQAGDVKALAALYDELQKLESSGADRRSIDAKREEVMAKSRETSARIEQQMRDQIGQNALFAVAGSVIHRAGSMRAEERAQLIESFREHREASASAAGVGSAVASKVRGASYEPGGTFRIKTELGETTVRMRRSDSAERVVHDGGETIIEIPNGLTVRELEAAVVRQLDAVRIEAATPKFRAAAGGSEHGGAPLESAARATGNGSNESARVAAAKAKFNADEHGRWQTMTAMAEDQGQRVLMERALAAGHSLEEIDVLRLAMTGMSPSEAMLEFSGEGVVQFFQQSCVPTSYQIALSEVDPLFALHLRNNPEAVVEAQAEVLRRGGATPTKREDARLKEANPGKFKKVPKAVEEQLSNPSTKRAVERAIEEGKNSGGSTIGIEPTVMKAENLHARLEQATGLKYIVLTEANHEFVVEGDGKFHGTPHELIRQALDRRLPVLYSQAGHEQVITGYRLNEDGTSSYLVTNPATGKTASVPGSTLDFDHLPVGSVTVPDIGVRPNDERRAASVKGASSASKAGTASERARTQDDIVRHPHPSDTHDYQYDAMHPGPLSDPLKYGDPKVTKETVPAQGFYGSKYDVVTLEEDKTFYRVGEKGRPWGQWFTDEPLQSEAQYRIDVAVKREWSDPATGEVRSGTNRAAEQFELWSYTAVIPAGTQVFVGPVASQGGVFMGGPSTKQYYIPKPWLLEVKGAKIVQQQPFKRDGHVQQPPKTGER